MSKPSVVVGVKKIVTVKVTATSTGCETHPYAFLGFGDGQVFGNFNPSHSDATKWSGIIEIDPEYLINDDAGTFWGVVYLDNNDELPLGAKLTLKRNVLLPEVAPMSKRTVKNNKSFWVGTYIDRADWTVGEYGTYGNKLVRLQFRTKHGHYKTIKTVRSVVTAYEGSVVETKMKTKKSGYYRFLSDATPTTSMAVSKRVWVKVK